ncbi:MAG: outer membrane beta-barrel protein [Burkholderiaceae bacterium]
MNIKARLFIAAAICASPSAVLAQFQSQALAQPEQVEDVLTFNAGVEMTRDDNIFRLDAGIDPTPTYGKSSRSDTVVSGVFGVKFDRDISLQRITVSGEVRPVKYLEYSRFDNIGYTGLANWNWAIGRPWFGTLGLSLDQRMSDFTDAQQSDKNLQRINRFYVTAGMRLTPSWAVVVGADTTSLSNSTAAQRASDYDFNSVEAGARFAPGTGTELEFVFRSTDGKYPNRQVVDAVGGVLAVAGGVDNSFTQQELLARMQVQPSLDTKMTGSVGLTKRSFDNLSQRDFSGPTARLSLDWRPGGAFFMGVDLIRAIYSEELLTSNYVEVTQLRLRPSFRLTGKLTLNGIASIEKRSYAGDPGFVTSNNAVRDDDLSTYGVGLTWDYARNIQFGAFMRREERSSNYANLDFTANLFGLSAKLSF